jgi:hypothetical protein
MFCPILHLGWGRAASAQLAEILAEVQYRPFNVRVLSSNGPLSQNGRWRIETDSLPWRLLPAVPAGTATAPTCC